MAKRNLNRRQRWRIEKIQEERRSRVQRKAEREQPVAEALGVEQWGTVVAHFGGQVLVETEDGGATRCHFRANLEQLVVGDRVLWQPPQSDGVGVVTALEPRHSVLKRPDNYGNLKPVAANVDRLLVMFAPRPAPSSALLDRYLVAAELSAIEPVLVLNKTDLLDEDSRPLTEHISALYRHLGYQVIALSAHGGEHQLAPLQALLGTGTSAFVGQSGVGKSSLVNAVLPEAALEVGDVSALSGLGQHTTTTARLFHLPEGGRLIDSPGIREFGLWHIDEQELLHGYRDLSELAGHCRFRNCTHRHEPGCALRQAAQTDPYARERLENYFQIAATLDEQARARY